MRIGVIDNHTERLAALSAYFSVAPEIISKEKFDREFYPEKYDLIVLSGGSDVPTVLRHPGYYQKEMDLVKSCRTPILGICLGAEIIIAACGGRLKELGHKRKGMLNITASDKTLKKIFSRGKTRAAESHAIGAAVLPSSLVECASSADGIEIFKHKDKKIVGLQFHPEMTRDRELRSWLAEALGIKVL